MTDTEHQEHQEHRHEALTHTHPHFHVTHNRTTMGNIEHLSAEHEHEHNHAALTHTHYPHQDFDQEHGGEAHVHDHEAPTGRAEGPS